VAAVREGGDLTDALVDQLAYLAEDPDGMEKLLATCNDRDLDAAQVLDELKQLLAFARELGQDRDGDRDGDLIEDTAMEREGRAVDFTDLDESLLLRALDGLQGIVDSGYRGDRADADQACRFTAEFEQLGPDLRSSRLPGLGPSLIADRDRRLIARGLLDPDGLWQYTVPATLTPTSN
jgi:hypothetical protein